MFTSIKLSYWAYLAWFVTSICPEYVWDLDHANFSHHSLGRGKDMAGYVISLACIRAIPYRIYWHWSRGPKVGIKERCTRWHCGSRWTPSYRSISMRSIRPIKWITLYVESLCRHLTYVGLCCSISAKDWITVRHTSTNLGILDTDLMILWILF